MTRNVAAHIRCITICALLLPAVAFAQAGDTVSILPFINITGEAGDA